MEIVRACEKCGARHLFFYEPYQGKRVHSPATEELQLRCRACKEPLMEWYDKDGDTWFLVLENDESVPRLRERQKEHERKSEREAPASTRPSLSVHPAVWMLLVGLVVALVVRWLLRS